MKQTPLRRTPFARIKKIAHLTAGVWYLQTPDRHAWLWPANHMTEAEWDGTLLDWAFKVGRCRKTWHCVTGDDSRSDPGWFDRVFLFKGRAYLAELKVRNREGVANRPSKTQWEFISAGIESGLDVRVWTWPDDAFEAWEALTGTPKERCPYWSETRHE